MTARECVVTLVLDLVVTARDCVSTGPGSSGTLATNLDAGDVALAPALPARRVECSVSPSFVLAERRSSRSAFDECLWLRFRSFRSRRLRRLSSDVCDARSLCLSLCVEDLAGWSTTPGRLAATINSVCVAAVDAAAIPPPPPPITSPESAIGNYHTALARDFRRHARSGVTGGINYGVKARAHRRRTTAWAAPLALPATAPPAECTSPSVPLRSGSGASTERRRRRAQRGNTSHVHLGRGCRTTSPKSTLPAHTRTPPAIYRHRLRAQVKSRGVNASFPASCPHGEYSLAKKVKDGRNYAEESQRKQQRLRENGASRATRAPVWVHLAR